MTIFENVFSLRRRQPFDESTVPTDDAGVYENLDACVAGLLTKVKVLTHASHQIAVCPTEPWGSHFSEDLDLNQDTAETDCVAFDEAAGFIRSFLNGLED